MADKKPIPDHRKMLERTVREIVDDAKVTFEVVRFNIITDRLQNGLDCGVPAEHLSAIFDLSVEEVEQFRATGRFPNRV